MLQYLLWKTRDFIEDHKFDASRQARGVSECCTKRVMWATFFNIIGLVLPLLISVALKLAERIFYILFLCLAIRRRPFNICMMLDLYIYPRITLIVWSRIWRKCQNDADDAASLLHFFSSLFYFLIIKIHNMYLGLLLPPGLPNPPLRRLMAWGHCARLRTTILPNTLRA